MIPRLVERRHLPEVKNLVLSQMGIYEKMVADLGQPDWAFDLVFIEDDAMANLNSQFRSRASVTDVLSFSYLKQEGKGDCVLPVGLNGAPVDLWLDPLAEPGFQGQPVQVGEVVLAPGFITSRCQRQNWSVEDEFPLLVVHGALHLLGWDHQDQDEAVAMRDLEEKLLLACGLSHPLRSPEEL